jgi:hypothetical protein
MEFIEAGLVLLPKLVALGMDIEPLVERLVKVARGADPAPEDWSVLHEHEDALRAKLNDKSKDTQ